MTHLANSEVSSHFLHEQDSLSQYVPGGHLSGATHMHLQLRGSQVGNAEVH